jgi:hypothetical protein
MGHSGGGDVHSIYTHTDIPILREAIRRLDQWHAEKVRSLGAPPKEGKELSFPDNRNARPTESREHPDDGDKHKNSAE